MAEPEPIVIVVDDDASFRRSTERLIRSAGFTVQGFGTAAEFLQGGRPDGPACVVLDVRLPGSSGLELQRDLARAGIAIPIIFITAHGDIAMSVQAMKAGAVGFLTKPFREQDLFDALQEALQRDRATCKEQAELAELRRTYESLTPRQRQVMARVVSGVLNKQIAAELEVTEKSVKFHRSHLMRKMRARSLADLVRMAGQLEKPGPKSY